MDSTTAINIIANTIPELQEEIREQLYRSSKHDAKQAKLSLSNATFAAAQAQLTADNALRRAKEMQMALYEEITLTSEDL